ncbi:hypothetical protein RJ640_013087 [Escallonia rubra]|uniref:UBN2_2 domain-containing protein n=1 Tax=Escallonia rubra TaxID=112253 RepID=A0AA88UEB7_9ASTE|nr:hypothetical protein RJ640_013087 [Escallonia rubra]
MDLDYALRVDASAGLTAESSTEQKAAYEKWERSNRISLMIMKGSITTAIRGAIPDSDNVKLYLANIEEQFQGSSKPYATTLITKMVTLKYSGSNGVREHILRMNDMASQLKGLDMEISEDVEYSGSSTPRIINLEEIMDHVSIPVIRKVGASVPHIEDNDAPEVVPNDVPPITNPAPIPTIAYIVGMLGHYHIDPGMGHWKETKKVMRYLQCTKDFMLTYRKSDNLECKSVEWGSHEIYKNQSYLEAPNKDWSTSTNIDIVTATNGCKASFSGESILEECQRAFEDITRQ